MNRIATAKELLMIARSLLSRGKQHWDFSREYSQEYLSLTEPAQREVKKILLKEVPDANLDDWELVADIRCKGSYTPAKWGGRFEDSYQSETEDVRTVEGVTLTMTLHGKHEEVEVKGHNLHELADALEGDIYKFEIADDIEAEKERYLDI